MPKSEIQNEKDGVILRAEANLESAKTQLEFKKKKFAQVESTACRNDNTVRPSVALELAQRKIEVDLLSKRVTECTAFLANTIEDQPRRGQARKQATEKLAKAEEIEIHAFKLAEDLKVLQDRAADLREAARQALDLSNATLGELQRQAEEDKNREEKARQEMISMKETNLRSAELNLASAVEGGNADIIRQNQETFDRRKVELEETLKKMSAAGAV